jgi:hypothetical protein
MKQYTETIEGDFLIGVDKIPNSPGNIEFKKMNEEVLRKTAQIINFNSDSFYFNERVSSLKNLREGYRRAGFIYDGHEMPADTISQSNLSSIILSYISGVIPPEDITNWKVSNGVYLQINGIQGAKKFGSEMLSYVQKCFTVEGQVMHALVNDNSINEKSMFKFLMTGEEELGAKDERN